MTKAKALEVIVRAFPYSEQVCDIDLDSEPEAVRFSWRSHRFRLALGNLSVETTVPGGFLCGGDISILAEALIRRVAARISAEPSSGSQPA